MPKRLPMTPKRQAILDVIRESHEHLTAAEIHQRVQQKIPGVAYATVYNSLAALIATGEVLELSFGDKASRYDRRNDRHDHAICLRCGALVDVDSHMPESVIIGAAAQSGFHITRHQSQFYGYCRDCFGSPSSSDP